MHRRNAKREYRTDRVSWDCLGQMLWSLLCRTTSAGALPYKVKRGASS